MFKKEAFIAEVKSKMEKSIEALRKDLSRIRTGRASLTLLDGVRVNYYGVPTPLSQVASLSVPESRTISIQPWDPKIIGEIEKAIQKSDLGLTPLSDGKIVRINIPPLTEERRKELVKVVKRMEEECKVAMRNIRRDANEQLKTAKKDKNLSEDDQFKYQEEIQKLMDKSIEKAEEVVKAKEKEILEV
ncbi:MAG: ribosome recycling factor [Deltaproteobacteria bacterium]|jgi:ribosome recycling factor|nr:ribosome recycling factor [Deltaproteobacteria bacterium]MDP3039214.1 ribosome recycling factor [Deltaproteobacteria bacterium]